MNLKELIEKRRSIRAYLPQDIPTDKLDYILECARLAPSACNLQPWFLYIVTSGERKTLLQHAYNRDWFKTAPIYIVVCADIRQSWKRTNTDNKDHYDIDASILSEHICLAAEETGLGTCWVCNFNPDLLKPALDLPDYHIPIAIFPIGFINEKTIDNQQSDKNRKAISEITKWL